MDNYGMVRRATLFGEDQYSRGPYRNKFCAQVDLLQ